MKFVYKLDHKNVENSKIGPNLETLTSNTRELVDSNFNQLSFIQGLGAEALVRGVGGRGAEPPYNCDEFVTPI